MFLSKFQLSWVLQTTFAENMKHVLLFTDKYPFGIQTENACNAILNLAFGHYSGRFCSFKIRQCCTKSFGGSNAYNYLTCLSGLLFMCLSSSACIEVNLHLRHNAEHMLLVVGFMCSLTCVLHDVMCVCL